MDIDLSYHWVLHLNEYRDNPFWRVIDDFKPNGRKFLNSAYLIKYVLESGLRISLIHYHSEFESKPFPEIQNLVSYLNMQFLTDFEQLELVMEPTHNKHLDLSDPNALDIDDFKFLNQSALIIITNESGKVAYYTN